MSDATRITLFTNIDEYLTWQHNNCDRCVKQPACPLEEAIASACVLDGTIADDVATRLGVPSDGRERWWCNEIERATPAPASGAAS